MHGLQTLKHINEQAAATRALDSIRKSAELGKANRMKRIKARRVALAVGE